MEFREGYQRGESRAVGLRGDSVGVSHKLLAEGWAIRVQGRTVLDVEARGSYWVESGTEIPEAARCPETWKFHRKQSGEPSVKPSAFS